MESFRVPEVDMMTVSKNSMLEREFMLKFVPRIGLTNVSYGSMYRVDKFYLDSQEYRDMTRDPYNKMLPPKSFTRYRGKCGIKIDPNLIEMSRPPSAHVDCIPLVYPVEYGHPMDISGGFRLQGRYGRQGATTFRKR
ncbi:uncharacterized protein Dana_GF17873 [Drosophila ananassae]|uniref:Uncharacterized protein n=1 Tax=Drosophila ananassae TaxID=7217 RepID=B3M1W4_DROAN|nr:uncharacterized protein LOC6500656 [Drosophila ananassae]EDV42224.1 uncharacterized protein Dana_GF17873 [Drosophila ananassae]